MIQKFKKTAKSIKNRIELYRAILQDKRTPKLSKILLGIAIGYFLLPIDIIPDFIPILGQLDDVIIVPGLIFLALRFIPRDIVLEHKSKLNLID